MKLSVHTICLTGLLTAVIAVLSLLTIPTPWGVPFTLQTFAVALAGYTLGARFGCLATALYILLGVCGLPVFSGMKSGPGVLAGPTGGYLWGFLFLALFCGLGMHIGTGIKGKKRMLFPILLGILGLALCHIPGIIQYRLVSGLPSFANAALLASVPYLPKDILSVAGALLAASAVRRVLPFYSVKRLI